MERLDEKTRGLEGENGNADEDALAESAADVAVSPELAAGWFRDYLRLWVARPARRERRASGRRRPGRDHDHLPVAELEVPDLGQHRELAGAGRGLHDARTGRGLRTAPRRDRPVRRLRGRPVGRRRRGVAHDGTRELAVVGGDPGRASGMRCHRPTPRDADHPARAALIRGHARGVARLARRDAGDPRQWGHPADPGQRRERRRQRQPHAGSELDRDARAGRGVRVDDVAQGRTPPAGAWLHRRSASPSSISRASPAPAWCWYWCAMRTAGCSCRSAACRGCS